MKIEIEKSLILTLILQIHAANTIEGKIVSLTGLITEKIKASVKHRLQKIRKKLLEEHESIEVLCKDLSPEEKAEFMKDKTSFEWDGCDYDMLMDFSSETNYDFEMIEEYLCEKKTIANVSK